MKCTRLSWKQAAEVYGNAAGVYVLSKFGGICLGMATLILYNRYITDSLTSLMAFDADMLHSLDLRANGLGIQTEIIAKLCQRGEHILEIPVAYQPKRKAAGRKRKALEGVRAFLPLFTTKY